MSLSERDHSARESDRDRGRDRERQREITVREITVIERDYSARYHIARERDHSVGAMGEISLQHTHSTHTAHTQHTHTAHTTRDSKHTTRDSKHTTRDSNDRQDFYRSEMRERDPREKPLMRRPMSQYVCCLRP